MKTPCAAMCSQQWCIVSDNRAKHQSVAVFGHREATLPEDSQILHLLCKAKKTNKLVIADVTRQLNSAS